MSAHPHRFNRQPRVPKPVSSRVATKGHAFHRFAAKWLAPLGIGLLCAGVSPASADPVNMLTWHNNNARTGVNSSETILTPEYVNSRQFGKMFTLSIADAFGGGVSHQPLYVSNLAIPGKGTHNVIFVGTNTGVFYAFDADSNTGDNAAPLWSTPLLDRTTGETTFHEGVDDGVTGTPVIDLSTNSIFFDCRSYINDHAVHRLHALDLTTGAEKPGSPVVIAASTPGAGNSSENGILTFGENENQRPGLLLSRGVVYLAYGAYNEPPHPGEVDYHGWLLGYDAKTLQQVSAWCVSPNGSEGGIWMAGAAPAADAQGNIYLSTGNGTQIADNGGLDYGDSFLKLNTDTGLWVSDFAAPANNLDRELQDIDLGSSGVVLLPDDPATHQRLLVGFGKEGTLFTVNCDDMGGVDPADAKFVQHFQSTTRFMLSTPVYWKNTIYYCGTNDTPTALHIENGVINTTPVSKGKVRFGYSGATGSLSSNGDANGILWCLDVANVYYGGPVVLRAFDAADLSKELYDSNQVFARDNPNGAIKFTLPTVANGKVYVPASRQVAVYGLLPPVYGDVNNDGTVDLSDVSAEAAMAAGLAPASNLRNADIVPANADGTVGDGRVDMADVVSALRIATGVDGGGG